MMYTLEQKYAALKRITNAQIDAIAEFVDESTFNKIALRSGQLVQGDEVAGEVFLELISENGGEEVVKEVRNALNAKKQGYPNA